MEYCWWDDGGSNSGGGDSGTGGLEAVFLVVQSAFFDESVQKDL